MKFSVLQKGYVVGRINRFVVEARIDNNRNIPLHLPNSGRLRELIVPGRELGYIPFPANSLKKTCGKLVLVYNEYGEPVCIDATMPNDLIHEALLRGHFEQFRAYPRITREYRHGKSRFDFRLENAQSEWIVEVKSVTLVEDGVAMFPDAPTERGLRHLRELGELQSETIHTAVIFVVQRSDARSFTSNRRTQPEFAEMLRTVTEQGVTILIWDCRVTRSGMELNRQLPLVL